MTVALEELGFGLNVDWITPLSRCYRPSCWPPARDWVVSEDRNGRVISRWGDHKWDLSHIAGKPVSLNFGDGPVKAAMSIDPANADLLRFIVTWFLWGHPSVNTVSNLVQAFQSIRPIVALCSENGILASNLMRFPKVLEQVPSIIAPSAYSTTITRLHRLLDAREKLGFLLVDTEGLQRLALA